MNQETKPNFPNFMQVEPKIPRWFWQIVRMFSILTFTTVVWGLWNYPKITLVIFWGAMVPSLPLVFWLMPGLWRNICPLAAVNQLPRLFNFSLAKEVPAIYKRYASTIGLIILFHAVFLRKLLFNEDPHALSYLLITAIFLAFIGGILFKGKSGWCGSFCPLLSVQRLYGQTPIVEVNNSHCKPCVGCTKNCFDFNPQVAYLADLYDEDPMLANDRKLFAGIMPGLLLAYFAVPYSTEMPTIQYYFQFALYGLVSIGIYQILDNILKLSPQKNTALFALISINIFYWYASVILTQSAEIFLSVSIPDWFYGSLRGMVFLVSFYWFSKTLNKEKLFLAQIFKSNSKTKVASIKHLKKHGEKQSNIPVVTLEPTGEKLKFKPNMTLLDIIEANGHTINAGCRSGSCGADPVAIIEGEDDLPEKSAEEEATLTRLGYKHGVRMACCIKIASDVSISLDLSSVEQEPEKLEFDVDQSVKSVVIIGNGIAGVTAADFVRRYNQDCKITLIGAEKYPFYNRMAISKLIYGNTALQSLIMMPDDWYKKRNIQQLLNTQVDSINTNKKIVEFFTGDSIDYDRLIITTGSDARIPAIKNWGLKGCFALRTADDGMAIRAFLQDYKCKTAAVSGGGLLGLEAAYAFTQVGMRVTVFERSSHLLKRQLDERSAKILNDYLLTLGIKVECEEEVDEVIGTDRVSTIRLKSNRKIFTNILLVAAGIVSNKKLTTEKSLKGSRSIIQRGKTGILVNKNLRTSNKDVFAAGDIAELVKSNGMIHGLWAVAIEQGKVAAINVLGGSKLYQDKPVATGLKVAGVELTSMGRFNGGADDIEIYLATKKNYRKLVINNGIIVGCILLGYPEYAAQVTRYINESVRLSEKNIIQLKSGNWGAFK